MLNDAFEKRIPLVTDMPTIIFGADVTHPQPGEDLSPSIAAVSFVFLQNLCVGFFYEIIFQYHSVCLLYIVRWWHQWTGLGSQDTEELFLPRFTARR